MTVLEWDKVGERFYQTGVDRGVLYPLNGPAVPWNGITSVEDNANSELKSYYLDGVKILDHVIPGDFSGKLSAFTYPEEFDEIIGVGSVSEGLSVYDQPSKLFNLSYRTKISNDLDENLGYKIHLFYNLITAPDSNKFESIKEQGSANEFSWAVTGSPPISTFEGIRPTVHISIDSTKTNPMVLRVVENLLYGTDDGNARFPSIEELFEIFTHGNIVIDSLLFEDQIGQDWRLTVTNDGVLQLLIDSSGDPTLDEIVLESVSGDLWDISVITDPIVTSDSTIDVSPNDSDGILLENLLMNSPDGGVWSISVTNDGTLSVNLI